MMPDICGYSFSACRGVFLYFLASEAEDRPVLLGGSSIKRFIMSYVPRVFSVVPITTVGLNEQPCILEHKVWLPPLPHSLVHFKLQPPLLEFMAENFLDIGKGKTLPQSSLAYLFSLLRRDYTAKRCFTHPLQRLRRIFTAKMGLTYFRSCLRRLFPSKSASAHLVTLFRVTPLAQGRLPYLFTSFGRDRVAWYRPTWHSCSILTRSE